MQHNPGMESGPLGVVVHPRRPIDHALDAARSWAADHGRAFGQIVVSGQERRVADQVEPSDCAIVVAMGGDGTVLAALHAAAPHDLAVLGVACGSLGALTSVKAPDIRDALDRVQAGEARPRDLPALAVSRDGTPIGEAFNDVVVVRAGAGQVILDVADGSGPMARTAGDGVIVATPLGSSAYTLAAGGPLVSAGTDLVVVTPLAPHAGSVPPVVLGPETTVEVGVDGGWAGARVELDGRIAFESEGRGEGSTFGLQITLRRDAGRLLDLDGETLVAGLRRRGVIADSPRLRAREARRARDGG